MSSVESSRIIFGFDQWDKRMLITSQFKHEGKEKKKTWE